MTQRKKFNFFASKAKKGKKSLGSGSQIKPQVGNAETSTHQQPHTQPHKAVSSSSAKSHCHPDAATSSRIPHGTRVIELRAPVPLASLVIQSSRQKGAKTERYRLSAGDLRVVDDGPEEPDGESDSVIPTGMMTVALQEPVPLASFREVPSKGREKRRGQREGREKVRIVVRS